MANKRTRTAPLGGTDAIWPSGIEARYGISNVTRWRWERDGKLPARDLHIGGRSGWKRITIEAAEQKLGLASPDIHAAVRSPANRLPARVGRAPE